MKDRIHLETLFEKVLGDKIDDFIMPPPSFTIFDSEVIEFNEEEQSICVEMVVPDFSLNPYGTMQGGMIVAALDNAIGPLSMLVAPLNMTRRMSTDYIRPIKQEMGRVYARARLIEKRKKRLFFEATLEDADGRVYVKATAENWVIAN